MITQLTFTQPTIGAALVGDEAERFLANFVGDELTALDATLLAVLRRDTRKVRIFSIKFTHLVAFLIINLVILEIMHIVFFARVQQLLIAE